MYHLIYKKSSSSRKERNLYHEKLEFLCQMFYIRETVGLFLSLPFGEDVFGMRIHNHALHCYT